MNPPDVIEFWVYNKVLLRIQSSMVPPVGSGININKVTYKVESVSFSVDYADKVFERQMRCNVELVREGK